MAWIKQFVTESEEKLVVSIKIFHVFNRVRKACDTGIVNNGLFTQAQWWVKDDSSSNGCLLEKDPFRYSVEEVLAIKC